MKRNFIYVCLMMFGITGMLSSCTKEATVNSSVTKTSVATTTTIASLGAISISPLPATTLTGTKDSLYLVNCYSQHSKKDTIASSALPTAIATYLTTNYAGYTFAKAYKITDNLNVITNYVVVIKYNSSYIGLAFTSTGTFAKVLEQRAGVDLLGKGWHDGGPFNNRDCKGRDTIALTAIPSAVKNYFTASYPTDTLLHASVTPDLNYVLISKNKVLYSTVITAGGTLVKRVQIDQHNGLHTSVSQANLPAAISAYLTSTYPGYVFDKAYSETVSNVLQGYDVFITVNSTNYVVIFSAAGAFVKAIVIH
jgi:hypothetical protein